MQQKLQREAASVGKLDEIWTKKSWRCLKYGNRGRSNRQILYFQCIVKYKSLNPIAHPIYFIYLLTLLLIHLHFMLFIYFFPPQPSCRIGECASREQLDVNLVCAACRSSVLTCLLHPSSFPAPCFARCPRVLLHAFCAAVFLLSFSFWSCCPSIFLLSLKRSELAEIIFQPLRGLPAGAPTLEQKERG